MIRAELLPPREGGLRGPITEGHRSVAYRFAGLDDDQPWVFFGALVERVMTGGEPGSDTTVVVRFYHDLAEVYATVGTEVDLWYGRLVGSGHVTDLASDAPVDTVM